MTNLITVWEYGQNKYEATHKIVTSDTLDDLQIDRRNRESLGYRQIANYSIDDEKESLQYWLKITTYLENRKLTTELTRDELDENIDF